MNGAGSKRKGSSFERSTCVALSRWVSNGEHTDLFARNVLSGGKFTRDTAAGRNSNLPGDLTATHPLAHEFLATCVVECKHRNTLDLTQYLEGNSKSFIAQTISTVRTQAEQARRQWLLVAKANRRPTLVFLPDPSFALTHLLFNRVWCGLFDDLLKGNVAHFLTAMRRANAIDYPEVRRPKYAPKTSPFKR